MADFLLAISGYGIALLFGLPVSRSRGGGVLRHVLWGGAALLAYFVIVLTFVNVLLWTIWPGDVSKEVVFEWGEWFKTVGISVGHVSGIAGLVPMVILCRIFTQGRDNKAE